MRRLTYIIDPSEQVQKSLLVPRHELDRVNQLLPLPMRHHGQLVDIVAKTFVDKALLVNEASKSAIK